MNTLCQKITAGLGLALSLSLASCEKDSLLTPNPAGNARSGATNDVTLPSPNLPQVHRLTKYGEATLTYADNGQLLTVTIPNRSSLDIQTDYTYNPGSIRAFSHQGKIVLRDETFTLDASGRCTESVVKGKYSDINWTFNYDAKGRLGSIYNKNSCVGGTSYGYNTEGDLITATVATSPFDSNTITFTYSPQGTTAVLDDMHPLNVVGANEHDMYLRIFGRPSKHLIRRVSYGSSNGSPVLSDQFYAYGLDAEGYVLRKVQGYSPNGAGVTTLYEYVVTNIPFQF